ncbi:MAG: CmcI family methyltransferase [Candidatus Dojkabacteria bacterium]|nr:CmcI family methyltransferase [Candidatus Dojkabacteria bacterium]
MKLIIDTNNNTLTHITDEDRRTIKLHSKESFALISHQWLKVAWSQKYPYTFTWLGRPIIQIPEDIVRIQEVIYKIKPDVIIETGVAHGGSLILYASLCNSMRNGRVIGVDVEIRPYNLHEIKNHELSSYITLLEGASTDNKIIEKIKSLIKPDETVIVILDSNHSKQNVLDELNLYSKLVTKNSYIIAADGFMKHLYDVPRGKSEWLTDNPVEAILEFVSKNPDFIIKNPERLFNESELNMNITYWTCAFLKRIK